MLLEDFYEKLDIKKQGEASLIVKVNINKSHQIFNGHFPNNPVTPGVLMLQIIKNCLEAHSGESLLMKETSNIKFLSSVNPEIENELIFDIAIKNEQEQIKIKNHTSFKDGRSVLKCNATFVTNPN